MFSTSKLAAGLWTRKRDKTVFPKLAVARACVDATVWVKIPGRLSALPIHDAILPARCGFDMLAQERRGLKRLLLMLLGLGDVKEADACHFLEIFAGRTRLSPCER